MITHKIIKKLFKLLYFVLLLCCIGCIINDSKNLLTVNVALTVFISSVFIPLILYSKNKRFDPFEPIYIFSIFFVTFYGISSLYVYNRKELFTSSLTADIYRTEEVVPILYALTISYLFFFLSYRFVMSKIRSKPQNILPDSFPKKIELIIGFLYTISIAFRIYGYSTGKLGSLVQDRGFTFPGASVLLFNANIWFVYFSYFTVKFFQKHIAAWKWGILVIAEVAFILMSGDRRYVLLVFFIILATYYYSYKSLPWRLLTIGGGVLFLVYLPFTTLYGYVLEAETFGAGGADYSVIFSAVFSQILEMPFDDVIADFVLNPVAESMFLLPNCQIAYRSFDLLGLHWGGVGVMNLVNSIVPSFIIPRTDVRPYIQLFTDDALKYQTDYSPLTFQMPTENIICFGLYSMPFIYLVIGITLSLTYKTLIVNHKNPFSRVIYVALIFWLTYCFQFGLLTTEFTTPFRVLIYYLIVYYCFGFNKRIKITH